MIQDYKYEIHRIHLIIKNLSKCRVVCSQVPILKSMNREYGCIVTKTGEVLNARSVLARQHGRQGKGRKKALFSTS